MSNSSTPARRLISWTLCCVALAALAACGSSRPLNKAPVEDRNSGVSRPTMSGVPVAVPVPEAGVNPATLPGAENAGKPGYYTVKQGETLIRIAMDNGQSWRDLVRWNNIENPNRIEIGQVLRVVPPGVTLMEPRPAAGGSGVASTSPVISAPVIAGAPLPAPGVSKPAASGPSSPAATPVAGNEGAGPDEDVGWIWPTAGTLVAGFDEAKNKGLDLGGKLGDPVYAVGDGRVVYAGAGLRGYGNLVILKHNNTYLSAYAHNQALLVKEDQTVRKGQKIAEMGNSDADRVKLHFEIRRLGKPVDPSRYLPAR